MSEEAEPPRTKSWKFSAVQKILGLGYSFSLTLGFEKTNARSGKIPHFWPTLNPLAPHHKRETQFSENCELHFSESSQFSVGTDIVSTKHVLESWATISISHTGPRENTFFGFETQKKTCRLEKTILSNFCAGAAVLIFVCLPANHNFAPGSWTQNLDCWPNEQK